MGGVAQLDHIYGYRGFGFGWFRGYLVAGGVG